MKRKIRRIKTKLRKETRKKNRAIRPKKRSLISEIGRVKLFLSPTRPHNSTDYENIYFLFQKKRTHTTKFPLADLFVQIYVFLP